MRDSYPFKERVANMIIRWLLHLVCKLDIGDLKKVPRSGPLILITNHTTNIEGPAIYVLTQPRKTTALAKIELWQNPVTRFLMNLWKVIPVHRGQVDSEAMKACFAALEDGRMLGIAPEGTRSKSGNLKPGGRGAAMLALRTGAPVCPVGQVGYRDIPANLKRLRRTPVSMKVGRLFIVRSPETRTGSAGALRQIADEMMYQIALLLPPESRGVYADLDKLTTDFLDFDVPPPPAD